MTDLTDNKHLRLPVALVLLVVFLLLLWQVSAYTRNSELGKLQAHIETNLARYTLSLNSELDKYRSLPALLATNDSLQRVLSSPQDLLLSHHLNVYLERVSLLTGASDIYLMAPSGDTLSASNWQQVNSFIGRNFHYRPYFQQAMAGKEGNYFALGTTSRKRGYYFSHPVRRGTDVIGVVVVKIDLNDIEEQWNDPLMDLLVTDIDDVVFISTRKEWKFKTLQPLSQADMQRIEKSLRYVDQKLVSLPVVKREPVSDRAELLTLLESEDGSTIGPTLSASQYMALREELPRAELNVVALAKLTTVQQQVWNAVLVTAVVFVVVLLAILFLLLRRRIHQERQRFKQQATRALEANEARIRAVIDNTQVGLITLDAQGCIESVNPTAEAQFGYSAELATGCDFRMLVSEADRPLCWRMIIDPVTPIRGQQAPVLEAQGLRQDGSIFPVELTVVQMAPQGERKFIVTIHDMTVRKEYEAHLRDARDQLENRVEARTADLQIANARLRNEIEEHHRTQEELIQTAKMAVLGQLSAGINHELNQPLTAIRAYADNARSFLERERYEPVANNLAEIAGLTARMAKIISPLKVFSRKSSGQAEPVALQSVRDGAMSILYARLQGGQVEVLWPDGLEDVVVMGDMVRLEQVVVNLISNAIQAMQDSPVRRLTIEYRQDSDSVELSFADTGPGIPVSDLAKVFEPFFTTQLAGEGLGLGLSISHRIVESLGGQLSVANNPQGGAQFTLKLRRAAASA
ncbi:MAG TPA: ATP-binding protein [Motiliproteus sp.]